MRIGAKNLTLDKDFVMRIYSLARYIEMKRRHFTATLQEPNQTCQTEDGYNKTRLRKADNLNQDCQNEQISKPPKSIYTDGRIEK